MFCSRFGDRLTFSIVVQTWQGYNCTVPKIWTSLSVAGLPFFSVDLQCHGR